MRGILRITKLPRIYTVKDGIIAQANSEFQYYFMNFGRRRARPQKEIFCGLIFTSIFFLKCAEKENFALIDGKNYPLWPELIVRMLILSTTCET